MSQHITLRTVPALTGWQWITRGWTLLMSNPMRISIAVMSLFAVMLGLNFLPLIGGILGILIMPALYLGVMATIAPPTASKPAAGRPVFLMMLHAFRDTVVLKRLLMLGLTYLCAIVTVLAVFTLLDDGVLFKIIKDSVKDNVNDAVKDSIKGAELLNQLELKQRGEAIQKSLLLLMACYSPVALMFWFTQPLVGWHGHSVGKSIFFSLLGCWRNVGAFAVYAAAWLVLLIAGSLALELLGSLLGLPAVMGAIAMPLNVFLSAWLMCSFYASYESLVQVLET